MTDTILFSRSNSQVEAVTPMSKIAASAKERINIAFSKEHFPGTASLLFDVVACQKTVKAATRDKDWIRVGNTYIGMATLIATLCSKRNSAYPEADTLKERVIKAARHPDTYAMHAYAVYGFLPTFVNAVHHLQRAIKNPEVEYPRFITGSVILISFGLMWKSMFGNKKAMWQQEKDPGASPPENMLQFILSDKGGLIGRLLPTAASIGQWIEGEVKMRHSWESGKDFRFSGTLSVLNDLVMIGYTYRQLWNAEKQRLASDAAWKDKVMGKKENNVLASAVER